METKTITLFIILGLLFPLMTKAQNEIIEFTEDDWDLTNAQVTEHLGRRALMGNTVLKDVEFSNGIIEVDLSVTGVRSYPGINFRMRTGGNHESFYVRPHRAGLYPDALQYTPVINNISCWQLYNGEGYTSFSVIPENEWIHIKMEIHGNQARVYIDNSEQPSLIINYLKHGISNGSIGLNGPRDGSAYFSNFSFKNDNNLVFDPAPLEETPPGIITEWKISQPFGLTRIDFESSPEAQGITDIKWQKVECEPSGLVNIAWYTGRAGREPDVIFAKAIINSDENEVKQYSFGYSDYVSIFLNGELLFVGGSAYRQRDPSFLGIVGLFDNVYIPLIKGRNEITMMVAETFGGWGFMAQDGKAVYLDDNIKKKWETKKDFYIPESVLYDKARNILYVTNFDQFNMGNPNIDQFISKVTLDGKVKKLKWITGLNNPLGMTIYKDKLYVSERRGVAQIDLKTEQIEKRHPVPGAIFLNDIAIDSSGNIYISDSRKNVVWKSEGDTFIEWLTGEDVIDPNALYIHDNKLLVGSSGDQSLKSVDINTKEIEVVAKLDEDFIDGIRIDKNGNYIVSLWRGRIYRITPMGEVTKIFDTTTPGIYSADFEYIPGKNLLIIPTFYENKVMAYTIN